MYPESFQYPAVGQPLPGGDGGYPGPLPPPVQYPRRRRRTWWVIAAVAVAVVVIAGVVAAVVVTGGRDQRTASGTVTESAARTAIQNYLDALTNGDDETVARNALCGLFDAVDEKRSDMALASLSSDAFRKQYSSAEVQSIDKMVSYSAAQAQVLFTLKVTPASRSSRPAQEDTEQAVAQVLSVDGDVLVCSYLPRTAGQY